VLGEHTGDRAEVAGDTQAVAQFPEGGVGALADEFQEACDGGRVELGSGASAVVLGLDRTGPPSALQEADEEGQADREQVSNLAEGVFAPIDGGNDAFAEIGGLGSHGDASFLDTP
jgi:hypothetical protein